MSSSIRLLPSLVLASLAALALTPLASRAQTNAFPEGTFDLGIQTTTDPKTNGLPVGWEFLDGRTSGFPGVTFSTGTFEGSKFARLINNNTSPDAWAEEMKAAGVGGAAVGLRAVIPIPNSRPTHVRLSARVRVPEVTLGTQLSWASLRDHPIFLDAQRKPIGKPRPPIFYSFTAPVKDWVEREVSAPIPPEAAFIQIGPAMFNATGILEVDDYQVFFETIIE